MLSASVSAFYLGDRRVWSMWHCLSFFFLFWSWTQSSDRAVRRWCWVGWWVAASETWSENTCVRSDCWMIRSIPAQFRSVSSAQVLPKNSDQQTFCCRLGEACAVGLIAGASSIPPKPGRLLLSAAMLVWIEKVLQQQIVFGLVLPSSFMTIVDDVLHSHKSEHHTLKCCCCYTGIWSVYLNSFVYSFL